MGWFRVQNHLNKPPANGQIVVGDCVAKITCPKTSIERLNKPERRARVDDEQQFWWYMQSYLFARCSQPRGPKEHVDASNISELSVFKLGITGSNHQDKCVRACIWCSGPNIPFDISRFQHVSITFFPMFCLIACNSLEDSSKRTHKEIQ